MVETVEVKLESDMEGFVPPLPSPSINQTTSHESSMSSNDSGSKAVVFDYKLAVDDFLDRVCLVKLQEKRDVHGNADTKLWPAIRYSSTTELVGAVKDVDSRTAMKIKLRFHKQKSEGPCCYLLGLQNIEDSFIALGQDMVESDGEEFIDHIHDLDDMEEYRCNQKFQKALTIVKKRYLNEPKDASDEDEDSQSRDEATVAFEVDNNDLPSPPSNNQDNVEVITIQDSPDGSNKKRRGEGEESGTVSKKKTKKKTSKQTPKSKSRVSSHTMVTPSPSKSDEKEVAEYLAQTWSESHKVMRDEEAMELLKDKFGVTCIDGKFYLPSHRDTSFAADSKGVATSLTGLRKNLCEMGLPESTRQLTFDEQVDIARWVSYAHVTGLQDGQDIPDNLGRQINKFMDAWVVLRDNFGCSYANGKYKVPLSPGAGEEPKVFETTNDVDCHFARFGIQCIPDDPGDRLSQNDRRSIELFFANPSFEVLNRFKRIDDKAKRKRKRVSYGE